MAVRGMPPVSIGDIQGMSRVLLSVTLDCRPLRVRKMRGGERERERKREHEQ